MPIGLIYSDDGPPTCLNDRVGLKNALARTHDRPSLHYDEWENTHVSLAGSEMPGTRCKPWDTAVKPPAYGGIVMPMKVGVSLLLSYTTWTYVYAV